MADASFTNDPIDVSTLPQLMDEDFVPIDPNFLRVSIIGHVLFLVIVAGIAAAVLVLVPDPDTRIVYAIAGGFVALTLISAVLKVIEVRNIAYQVREHDLSYRNGVIVKRVQTVPFVRVQHARMRQGPVQRLFNLATLSINSAGPDIAITGLNTEAATALRALVVERAGDLVEEQ